MRKLKLPFVLIFLVFLLGILPARSQGIISDGYQRPEKCLADGRKDLAELFETERQYGGTEDKEYYLFYAVNRFVADLIRASIFAKSRQFDLESEAAQICHFELSALEDADGLSSEQRKEIMQEIAYRFAYLDEHVLSQKLYLRAEQQKVAKKSNVRGKSKAQELVCNFFAVRQQHYDQSFNEKSIQFSKEEPEDPSGLYEFINSAVSTVRGYIETALHQYLSVFHA